MGSIVAVGEVGGLPVNGVGGWSDQSDVAVEDVSGLCV